MGGVGGGGGRVGAGGGGWGGTNHILLSTLVGQVIPQSGWSGDTPVWSGDSLVGPQSGWSGDTPVWLVR